MPLALSLPLILFIFMFKGEYNHTIDQKGRLIIPNKFRTLLGDSFVMTRSLDGCLAIYDKDNWAKFEEKINSLPYTDLNARTFRRYFIGGCIELSPDKMGRVLVSQTLRSETNLKNDITFVGVGDHIEVWDTKTYNSKNNFSDSDIIARNMEGLGI